jgi:phospholipid/cholesterol/gamma-HCH transport system substrate-binding protein
MNSAKSLLRVGVFVILGVAALVAAIFLVGNQEGLFHPTFHVSAYFKSVEGVRSGSAIRLAGVDIGVVDQVEVSARDNTVCLDLKMNASARSFLKKDSYATIRPEGLVGSYYVDVTVGSREGEPIQDGDVLQSKEALRLSAVMDDAEDILGNIRRSSEELTKTLQAINEGKGTLGKLVVSDDVYRHLEHMSSQADRGVTRGLYQVDTLCSSLHEVARRADTLVTSVNAVVAGLHQGRGTMGALLADRTVYDSLLQAVRNTVRATEAARVGAGRFAEDMEAMKHNWLLKGYFEDRGYWDENDYTQRIDRKLDSLRILEQKVTTQMQELQQRNALLPK